ncbi:MAG: hypothetical protein ACXVP5_01115 [Tumebacillaceae bacterium]
MKATLSLALASVLIWGANLLGWWPITVLVGVLFAILFARKGKAIGMSMLAGVFGWGLQLVILGITHSVLPLAKTLGGILGLAGGAGTTVAILLPLLVGALLALSGAWITGSIRGVLPSSSNSQVPLSQGSALEQ